MRRALAIDEQSLGPDHPNVAIRLNNLALLLQDTNRLAEAEPLMRRALAIDEQSLGPDHPNVAIHLNNLAQLLQDTNRLAEAEPLMRRALEISKASLGAEHPRRASSRKTIICCSMRLRRRSWRHRQEPISPALSPGERDTRRRKTRGSLRATSSDAYSAASDGAWPVPVLAFQCYHVIAWRGRGLPPVSD